MRRFITPSEPRRAFEYALLLAYMTFLVGCAPLGPVRDALKSDAWMQSPKQFLAANPSPAADDFRWRHPTLDAEEIDGPYDRLAMKAALYQTDAVLATNAAIALARVGQDDGRRRLVASIRNRNLKMPIRLAATEALSRLPGDEALHDLQELVDVCERTDKSEALPPEIHAELLLGLARRCDPAQEPRLERGLHSAAADVRIAALRAWRRPGAVAPPTAIALCGDAQPRVRAAALAAVAQSGTHAALDALRRGAHDASPEVRAAAVAGLGAAASPDAKAALRGLLEHPSGALRAAAVRALAASGDAQVTADLIEDPQWEVRKALAESLASRPQADAVELACCLVDDASGEVQLAVVDAVEKWPAPQAGPVLIAAIEGPTYRTRQNAIAALVRKWPGAAAFQAALERDDRTDAMASLRGAWEAAFGPLPSFSRLAAKANRRIREALPPPSPETIAKVVRLLDDVRRGDNAAVERATAQLVGMGRELLPALEWIAADITAPIPDMVFERVLPQIEPAFAAAERLQDRAIEVRRRAADELRAAAAKTGLSDLAIQRIAALASLETDDLVLIAVMYAIESDPRAAAIRLALAAAGHAAPEVRRLAIEHLGRFGSSRQVQTLLLALEDPNAAVVAAALRALGKPGMTEDGAAIERFLASPDKNLRIEAATTLVRLGAVVGAEALERLAQDLDPKVRRRAVQRMGDLGAARFTPALLELLTEGNGVGDAALAALPACTGCDVCAERGLANADRQTRIAAWREWGAQAAR